MCDHRDASELLKIAGIKPNRNRLLVLKIVIDSPTTLTSPEILDAISASGEKKINKVTMYRILDLLVDHGILNRLSSPDRIDRYCVKENRHHPSHVHFFCEQCHKMFCLAPEEFLLPNIDVDEQKIGRISKVQILLNGTCRECKEQKKSNPPDL